jgi:hypothetical protein
MPRLILGGPRKVHQIVQVPRSTRAGRSLLDANGTEAARVPAGRAALPPASKTLSIGKPIAFAAGNKTPARERPPFSLGGQEIEARFGSMLGLLSRNVFQAATPFFS